MLPWLMIGAGAFVFWTIALGIGIPSLARVLGTPGPARWAQPTETRCISDATVDGQPVAFGDCFNVRIMLDSPEFGRPAFTVPREAHHGRIYAGPDYEMMADVPTRADVPAEGPSGVATPPLPDPVGRTSY